LWLNYSRRSNTLPAIVPMLATVLWLNYSRRSNTLRPLQPRRCAVVGAPTASKKQHLAEG